MFRPMMTLILVFLMAMLAYQCSSTLLESSQNVIRSSNIVSNNIYKVLKAEGGNVLFCPVSSNILLSLISLASKGKTAEELKTSLNLSSDEEIKSGYKNILKQLKDDKLKLATRMYPKTGVILNPEFLTIAQTYFNTAIQKIDFNNSTNAAKIINNFIQEKTNNKIHDVVDPGSLTSDTSLVLVNAAHFKDNWKYPFHKIFESDFYISKNEKVKTQMMENTNHYHFMTSDFLGAKVLQISFQNNHYSMLFILPDEVDGLDSVETKLDSIGISELIANLSHTHVQLQIPKFKIEANLNLKPVLQELGIKTIFSKDADLSGISTGTHLAVSRAIQKTFIDVNAMGVEAAAATVLVYIKKAQPPISPEEVFTADHPFIFAIMRGNLVLFQGRLSKV